MDEITVKLQLPREPSDEEKEKAEIEIANRLTERIKDKFTARNPARWKERMNPNIAGILEDLRISGNVKKRRFSPVVIGVDSGMLSRSAMVSRKGPGSFLFTCLSYGEQFHKGGRRSIKIDDQIRRNLGKWYFKNKKAFRQTGLGWLFGFMKKSDSFDFTQEARPIITRLDVEQIAKEVYGEIIK